MTAIYHLSRSRASVDPAIAIRALSSSDTPGTCVWPAPASMPCSSRASEPPDRACAIRGIFRNTYPNPIPLRCATLAHAAVQVAQAKERERAQNHHKILELDGENIENDDPVRPQDRRHQQNPEDRSRRADGRNPSGRQTDSWPAPQRLPLRCRRRNRTAGIAACPRCLPDPSRKTTAHSMFMRMCMNPPCRNRYVTSCHT